MVVEAKFASIKAGETKQDQATYIRRSTWLFAA
jgi:hypothetical protein